MDGLVIGIWKRLVKKDIVKVEVEMFKVYNRLTKQRITKAANNYGRFLGKPVKIEYKN
jgi:hypothetical protein